MGFGDVLGDTWDAFEDAGSASLGLVMDHAKASYNRDLSQHFDAQRSFRKKQDDFFSDHRTVAKISRATGDLLAGAIYVVGLPHHYTVRALGTGVQMVDAAGDRFGPNLLGESNTEGMSIGDAWRNSKRTSLAQSLAIGFHAAPEGATYSNAHRFGSGGDRYNPWFSWSTGTMDAVFTFADPLIVGGKAKKAVDTARAAIKSDHLSAVAGATPRPRVREVDTPAKPGSIEVPHGFRPGSEPGVWHHGGPEKIDELLPVDDMSPLQLLGPGFYTTELHHIAGSRTEGYLARFHDPDLMRRGEIEDEAVDAGVLDEIERPKLQDYVSGHPGDFAEWQAKNVSDSPMRDPGDEWDDLVQKAVNEDLEGYVAYSRAHMEYVEKRNRRDSEMDLEINKRRQDHTVRWKGDHEPNMLDMDKWADDDFEDMLVAAHVRWIEENRDQIDGVLGSDARNRLYDEAVREHAGTVPPYPYNGSEEEIEAWLAAQDLIDDEVERIYHAKLAEAHRNLGTGSDEEWRELVLNEARELKEWLRRARENPAGWHPVRPFVLESTPLTRGESYQAFFFQQRLGPITGNEFVEQLILNNPDDYLQGIRRGLLAQDVDGFTHIGGLLMGNGQALHRVNIWFDTDNLEIAPHSRGVFVAEPARLSEHRRLTEVLPADATGLARSQRKFVDDFDTILAETEGRSLYEMTKLFQRWGALNASGLASVLYQASNEPELRRLILRYSMGDQEARQVLREQRAGLISQIDRMNEDMDHILWPEGQTFGTPDHNGLFDGDPLAEAQIRDRDEAEAALDAYNRTLGDLDKQDAGIGILSQDDIGLFGSIPNRIRPKDKDIRFAQGQAEFTLQAGVGGVAVRVARAPRNKRPSGYTDFHDADQGLNELEAQTRRIPGMPAEQRVAMIERYIAAPDDNARRQVLIGIENEMIDHLGRLYGYRDDDIRAVVTKMLEEKGNHVLAIRNRGVAYGVRGDGTAYADPLLEAQLENGHFSLPIDLVHKTLRRNRDKYRALRNFYGDAFDIVDHMGDVINDVWKFQALFRGGYPVRNFWDGQLRMMAYLSALTYLRTTGENIKTGLKVGTRDSLEVGDYQVADAFGGIPDEAAFRKKGISSADTVANFLGTEYYNRLDRLRGTGAWKTKFGHEEGWAEDYLRVVNFQLRNSAIAQRLMRGDSAVQVIKWLKSGEGRHLRRRMLFGSDTPEALVARNLTNLNHILPMEMWSEVMRRPLDMDDVAMMWGDDLASRPAIHAEQVALDLGQGPVAAAYDKVTRYYYNGVSRLTDDKLARHPFFVALYRGRIMDMMRRSDPELKGALEAAEQRVLEEQARIWARREMKRHLFDLSQKSDLAHFVRFIMPFYAAWEDAITKYGRLIMRDPAKLAYFQHAWTAPNDVGLVVDQDGNRVPASRAFLSQNEYVVVPKSWSKALGVPWEMRLSKASFNIALQGDPIWAPGWGPMGAAPINEIIKKTDSPQMADIAQELGILPFGVQDNSFKMFYSGALRQNAVSDDRKRRLFAMVLQSEFHKAQLEGRKPPTAAQVKDKFEALMHLRTLTSALSPLSVQYTSPYQFYIDQSHAYDAQVGKKFKTFEQADRAFLKDFGDDFYLFRMSLSETNVPIESSLRADKAARRVRDLVERFPKFAAMFIGPDNTGSFNQNVYALQAARKLPGTDKTWRDTYDDPYEGIRRSQVEQGWIAYQKISTQLNSILRQRGLHSLRQRGAEDLAQIKRDWIEDVAGDGGPAWGREWYRDYQGFGSSALTDFLEAARVASKDKRINSRPDIQALGHYLSLRSQIRNVLLERRRAGRDFSITARDNADLAQIWNEAVSELRESNLYFEDYYNRYLERDDLTKVVR